MKVKDENDWSNLGEDLTDFKGLGKAFIPFSKKAQRKFDAHPRMIHFVNDKDVEICFSLQGSEYYIKSNESVRVSVSLNDGLSYVSNECKYSKTIVNEDLSKLEVRASQFQFSSKLNSSSNGLVAVVVIAVILILLMAS